MSVLVADRAERANLRAIVIKGVVASAQGLRASRNSADVDVLVDPREHERFVARLAADGWAALPAQRRAWFLPEHSVTMRHPTWPCEVDVHSYYPGFLADPAVVFDVLWESRTNVVVGGQPIAVGDPAVNAAILALHSLRAGGTLGRDPAYLPLVAAVRSYDPDLRQFLSDLAAQTGALDTLGPFLAAVEAPSPRVVIRGTRAEDLDAWNLLCQAGTRTTGAALVYELTRTGMSSWPRIVWRNFMLDEAAIRQVEPRAQAGRWGLWRARARRATRGLRRIPEAARLVRRSQQTAVR